MYRIQGTIKHLSIQPKKFGIAEGDDGKDYFFIPSSMASPPQFDILAPGRRIDFEPTRTTHGFRAALVTVLSERSGASSGEAILYPQ